MRRGAGIVRGSCAPSGDGRVREDDRLRSVQSDQGVIAPAVNAASWLRVVLGTTRTDEP